jgi:DNA (cytosine-5)-methyltransferase 1
MKNLFTHLDCFSGPGGFCTGFKAAGIKTILAIEKVESCVETYMKNHPEVHMIHKDIRRVEKEDLDVIRESEVDILTSGMPCETFSTAGSKSRSFYDHRQQLYYESIRLAEIIKPKIILFENVPGILSKKVVKGGERLIIDDIFDDLSAIGYKYYMQTTLLASDFGVPQARKRYFIIATADPEIKITVPTSVHNGKLTVKTAFEDLPKIEANNNMEPEDFLDLENDYTKLMKNSNFWKNNKGTTKLSYHLAPKHRLNTIERFKLIEPGENLKDLFLKLGSDKVKELQDKKILPKKWYIQRNKRLKWDEPSKTVTSHCLDELIHPELNRALTVREVARLQSFPDYYDFVGGPYLCPHIYETQDKYEQIGDAVPPLLAYQWGETIKKILIGKN